MAAHCPIARSITRISVQVPRYSFDYMAISADFVTNFDITGVTLYHPART